jgi:bifunctional non-homologous end joining protein LigD
VPRASSVRLSHPDKLLFGQDGITKADLAGYFEAVSEAMVRHARDRPLNLWRWNEGIEGPRVVQQEIPRGAPDWVKRVTVPRRAGGNVTHALANDAATLVWLANQNCVTVHLWTSRADMLDRPDRMIFDLDPPEGVTFAQVRRAARETGALLRELGLEPFAQVTGSRGIHVVAPLRRTRDHDTVRAAAGAIAAELAARRPKDLTVEWRKAKREGRILVDVARNTYAQTTVAPYSPRARPGAPVATPLRWEELDDRALEPDRWTLRTLPARLEEHGDPWRDIARAARPLPRLDSPS